MKRIKPNAARHMAPIATPLVTPYFKPRRLVREINFHLKVAAMACMALGPVAAYAQTFEPVVQLSSLDGSSGFRLDGAAILDQFGGAISAAGDVNGDGIDDLLIGAQGADSNGSNSGSSYVVFGSNTGFAPVMAISSLDGSTGFRLDGVTTNGRTGHSVSAVGDINGDGIDDLIIGAEGADYNGGNFSSSYVVFGAKDIDASAFFVIPLPGGGASVIKL